jgi:prephenate dehydrogenase
VTEEDVVSFLRSNPDFLFDIIRENGDKFVEAIDQATTKYNQGVVQRKAEELEKRLAERVTPRLDENMSFRGGRRLK